VNISNALIISNNLLLGGHIEDLLIEAIPDCSCYSVVGNQALGSLSQHDWNIIISDLTIIEITALQLIDSLSALSSAVELFIIQELPSVIADAIELHALHKNISVTITNSISLALKEIENKSCMGITPSKNFVNFSKTSSIYFEHSSSQICLEQIVAYYQPQICLKSGEIYGAEVLARWYREEHVILGPQEIFIVLNTPQLREALWQKMLTSAASTLQSLHGTSINLAVNVCADIVSSVNWSESLACFFREFSLNPEHFTVEITESPSGNSEWWLSGTVAQLRLRHFHCAIDDFGTGFSSLQRLATTPFNKLKIDKLFIHRARYSPAGISLLRSIVELAHNLGLIVIAEGVETKEDYERVSELGVDIAQGYYFAKPMPLENFMSYITSHRTALTTNSDNRTGIKFFL